MNKFFITVLCILALGCLVASPVSAKSYYTVTIKTVSIPKINYKPTVDVTSSVQNWLKLHPIKF